MAVECRNPNFLICGAIAMLVKEIPPHQKSRFLILRREGPGIISTGANSFYIHEIRAYSVPNLLEGSAVIEAPEPKDPAFPAKNLIENFENRSAS